MLTTILIKSKEIIAIGMIIISEEKKPMNLIPTKQINEIIGFDKESIC